jgi:hypothetical protein
MEGLIKPRTVKVIQTLRLDLKVAVELNLLKNEGAINHIGSVKHRITKRAFRS